ncbi:unnamed protein product [Dracunculus medinensis]|uniref:Uncharacterized protein n=1 Tax=Dracunculus medinensis TaxID=318479 RepID=A0A3P7SLP0_DRAME|nr:unnamed protein product [Dracunculus medinensis]
MPHHIHNSIYKCCNFRSSIISRRIFSDSIPGVLRFGKRLNLLQGLTKRTIPGVLRFGKRGDHKRKNDVPGVLEKKDPIPGVLRFGKRDEIPGVLRFGKRSESDGFTLIKKMPGLRF